MDEQDSFEVFYVEDAPNAPGSLSAFIDPANLRALVANFAAKPLGFKPVPVRAVDRMPELADADQYELDTFRRFFTHSDIFYKTLFNARIDCRTRASLEALARRRAQLRKKVQELTDAAEKTLHKDTAADAEDDLASKAAPATAPVTVRAPSKPKDFRPRGTAAPNVPLQASDFAAKASKDLRVRVNVTDVTIKKDGFVRPGMSRVNVPFSATWSVELMDGIERVASFAERRLTILLQLPSAEISQALCNQAFDDSVEFLLRDGQFQLKTYTKAHRAEWWQVRAAGSVTRGTRADLLRARRIVLRRLGKRLRRHADP